MGNKVNVIQLATATALLVFSANSSLAANFEVKMLNKSDAGAMVFEPALIRVAPGDTVTFVPTDKGHNAESIKGIAPEGGELFKGGIGKEVVASFTVPGIYGVKCTPHFGMGMVALIVVADDLSNLDAAKAAQAPPKAIERLEPLFAAIEAQ